MSGQYILNAQGEPVAESDLLTWAHWLEAHWRDRIVGRDKIGRAKVMTDFQALDYSFGKGAPVVWETMVFGGARNGYMERCAGTREQAEAMHAAVVAMLRKEARARRTTKTR